MQKMRILHETTKKNVNYLEDWGKNATFVIRKS